MSAIVDLAMSETSEGLDYHNFLADRCRRPVVVQKVEIKAGVLEFPHPHTLIYNDDPFASKSSIALDFLLIWRSSRGRASLKVRFKFDDAGEAMLFKLTFGGA